MDQRGPTPTHERRLAGEHGEPYDEDEDGEGDEYDDDEDDDAIFATPARH